MANQIGLDSQCLSYLIDAMASICRPSRLIAEQQLALIRCFFYLPNTLWVTQTVTTECARIRDIELSDLHKSFINILFGELPLHDPSVTKNRATELGLHHSGKADCLVLAEAEDVGHQVLLTFDSSFINRLSLHAKNVKLVKPNDYWSSLGMPHGIKPDKVPHPTNPLAFQDWWHW